MLKMLRHVISPPPETHFIGHVAILEEGERPTPVPVHLFRVPGFERLGRASSVLVLVHLLHQEQEQGLHP